jgi:hypothetical protein
MDYAIRRSIKNKNIHLIFMVAGFDDLPSEVRSKGPWQYLKSGLFERLLDEHQRTINQNGYVLIDSSVSVFSVES